jgi:gamma-glutamyltranspeptidase/glutathione hydrolase
MRYHRLTPLRIATLLACSLVITTRADEGEATDAAVAIAYALNVVEQQSAGVGGGGFMMIHLAASGRTFAIDTRNKTPAGATRDMSVGVPQASLQGVAAGVPGMVRGTAMALEKCGNLSLG